MIKKIKKRSLTFLVIALSPFTASVNAEDELIEWDVSGTSSSRLRHITQKDQTLLQKHISLQLRAKLNGG